jgi:hypothetical protein
MLLSVFLAVIVCGCHKTESKKVLLTFPNPSLPADAGELVDGGSGTDCGPKQAVCGVWTCQYQNYQTCITNPTSCVYGPDAAQICAYSDTELSNTPLGSAAQQVPGGVFCPSLSLSINSLHDPNNCGYCGHKCGGGTNTQLYCLNGQCAVP